MCDNRTEAKLSNRTQALSLSLPLPFSLSSKGKRYATVNLCNAHPLFWSQASAYYPFYGGTRQSVAECCPCCWCCSKYGPKDYAKNNSLIYYIIKGSSAVYFTVENHCKKPLLNLFKKPWSRYHQVVWKKRLSLSMFMPI